MRCFSGIEETLRPMLHSFHESIPIAMLTAAEEGMVSLWTNFYALIRAVLSIQVWCGRLLSLFMEWEQRMRERISLKEQIHTDSG